MSLSQSSDAPAPVRFIYRLAEYTAVGTGTFILDLGLLWVFIEIIAINQTVAIIAAFLIAVNINYLLQRVWVYRQSPESVPRTYRLFMLAMVAMSFLIPVLVLWLESLLGVNVFLARILSGSIIGSLSFLYNTFYNFKLL